MTLIVARMLADGPHLVCDSQLTDPDRQRPNPYSAGALKLVICDRGLCIGFAGGVHTGLQTILDVTAGGSGADVARVRRKLKADSRNSGDEFIVATMRPDRVLMRIRDGAVEDGLSGAFVGDQPAFSAYQACHAAAGSLRHELQQGHRLHLAPPERVVAARMLPAMMQVIEDRRLGGVAGMPICVEPSSVGFRYESVAVLGTDPDRSVDAEEEWDEPDWGTAAEGRFGYALKVPGVAGVGAIGAYFPHGRLGVLYYPARSEQPITYADVGEAEFCDAVEKEFGFSFGRRGLGFSPSGSDRLSLEINRGQR